MFLAKTAVFIEISLSSGIELGKILGVNQGEIGPVLHEEYPSTGEVIGGGSGENFRDFSAEESP